MLKILICEDDTHVSESIKFVLQDRYKVTCASDGISAMNILDEDFFHLVITDIVMPNADGYELLDYLSITFPKIPLVILSSLNSDSNQIKGYKYNIEEYITKPFNVELLSIKIDTILNRIYNISSDITTIDEDNKCVIISGDKYEFTTKEFLLFQHLIVNKNKYCNKGDLLLLLWNDEANERVVDYTIKRIRKKLKDKAKMIKTKATVGYMYVEK